MKIISLFTLIFISVILIGCFNQTNNKQEEQNKIELIKIPLPENWIDKSKLDLKDNLSKLNLSDREITSLLKTNNGSIPVVIYLKYDPSEFSGPIPTIQVNLRPNNNKDFSSFKKDLEVGMLEMGGYFTNYKIIVPLEEITIDSIKGVRFKSQFDLLGQGGETWTIRSWSYGFPTGKYFYQINFSDSEDENSECIYNELIYQIKFRK